MRTIGIIGGLAPESTATCYQHIIREFYARHRHEAYPEVVIYSMSFQRVVAAEYNVPEMIRDVVARLAAAGADFAIAACNSIHRVYDQVAPGLAIPWLSIVDATVSEVVRHNMTCVGLFGTRFTMDLGFYQRALHEHSIQCVLPSPRGQQYVDEVIYEELVRGTLKEGSRAGLVRHMEEVVHRGAQAIILGCTELPLLVSNGDVSVPLFDTTAILAKAALDASEEGVRAASRVGHRLARVYSQPRPH